MSYLQDVMARFGQFAAREREKRDVEAAELARVQAENAEYVARLDALPFGATPKE